MKINNNSAKESFYIRIIKIKKDNIVIKSFYMGLSKFDKIITLYTFCY